MILQRNGPTKRNVLISGGLSLTLGAVGCATTNITGDTSKIAPYSEVLQRRLFKQPVPFSAAFTRGPYSLTFVASQHATDPQSPTFQKVAQSFQRARPAKLIIEGVETAWGENPDAITSMIPARLLPNANSFARSEAVYAASLAASAGIPFIGGEPSATALNAALVNEGFRPDDIFFSNMLKSLFQNQLAGEITLLDGPAFAKAYAGWSQQEAQDIGVRARTSDEFALWYAQTFNKPSASDPDWADRFDPATNTISGKIMAAQMLLRDRHLFDLTITSLQSSRRVMMVYGASHLATLWAAFAASFGPPRIWL